MLCEFFVGFVLLIFLGVCVVWVFCGVCVTYLFRCLCCVSFFYLFFFPVCCMPNVTSVSGLSILDCPFGFLQRSFTSYCRQKNCLAHLAFMPCELLPSLFVRRPSINISHFNLLLRNHWANCNQSLVEWSMGGSLPKLCVWWSRLPTKMAAKLKIEKKGDEI